jgi:hypothetical protein
LAYNACVNDRGKLAVLDIKTIAAKWYLGELSQSQIVQAAENLFSTAK